MGGLVYLAAMVAVFVVVYWCVKNDKVPENSPTTGILKMKHYQQDKKE